MAGTRKVYTAEFKLRAVKMITEQRAPPSPRSHDGSGSPRTGSTTGRRRSPTRASMPSPDRGISPLSRKNSDNSAPTSSGWRWNATS